MPLNTPPSAERRDLLGVGWAQRRCECYKKRNVQMEEARMKGVWIIEMGDPTFCVLSSTRPPAHHLYTVLEGSYLARTYIYLKSCRDMLFVLWLISRSKCHIKNLPLSVTRFLTGQKVLLQDSKSGWDFKSSSWEPQRFMSIFYMKKES